MVLRACQSFQFSRQITWFLRNNRAFSEFKQWILHYLISVIKLQNNQSVKCNFILTALAILMETNRPVKSAYLIIMHIYIYTRNTPILLSNNHVISNGFCSMVQLTFIVHCIAVLFSVQCYFYSVHKLNTRWPQGNKY